MVVPVVINAASGSADRVEDSALAAALAEGGIDARIERVEADDLEARLERAAAAAVDAEGVLVAGGGDGTLNQAAALALRHDLTLGVLPLGTHNHFATDLGLPSDALAAARALARARPRAVDVGRVGDRVFLNNVSVGTYPMIVRERRGLMRRFGIPKALAMLGACVSVLGRSPRLDVVIERGDEPDRALQTAVLFVGNNRYGAGPLSLHRRARLDEGGLQLVATGLLKRLALLRVFAAVLRERPLDEGGLLVDWTPTLRLSVHGPQRRTWLGIDGERVAMSSRIAFRIDPGALRVLAPVGARDQSASVG